MRVAADAEDRTDKHVVTPGPIVPARELLGEMFLLQSNFRDAVVAFEATLLKEPNRLGATLGAGKAAERMGDRVRADRHYRNALGLAEGVRPDIIHAKTFISSNTDIGPRQ